MNIIIAKSAGFCYGVKIAIDKAIDAASKFDKVYSTGDIVHNDYINEQLKKAGVEFIESIDGMERGGTVIVRAHGVRKDILEQYKELDLNIVDTTCTNVRKIHEIVQEYSNNGYKIVIIGDKEHDEVKGIIGWINGEYEVISDENEINSYDKVCVVAQTTSNNMRWEAITNKIKDNSNIFESFNTICNATYERQRETTEIAQISSTFIVIGDKKSANSKRLFEIASKYCENTFFVQSEDDIFNSMIKGDNIGITAGASTPENIIKAVVEKIKNLQKDYT